jgi:hypothetical protein
VIRPEDVPLDPAGTDGDSVERIDLERACEDAIRSAQRTGTWPASVGHMRMPIAASVVAAVADEYRAIGRIVGSGGLCPHQRHSNCYFWIDHPRRQPTCRCGEGRGPR